ncbi:site-specific integrase [Cupriavidus basilensis]|uniref:Site-specific integrase n=1 Tax=Cupriavidus basilensis TaxID=68895 RepID=A0ABT6AH88_9BURK|nr:site-specific integrase [Cupriavidus basilensis]MDF3831965.1 site-specific integrase [Cupriavidus basilensis]
MNGEQSETSQDASLAQSVTMLKAVLEGGTYQAVAAERGVSRTAVERRVKSVAAKLCAIVGIPGLNEDGATAVRRLRQHRHAILSALDAYDPLDCIEPEKVRVLTGEEILQGAQRVLRRSRQPWHDGSLYYLLFTTGAWPLEIARLEVRDYLNAAGEVRRVSEWRADVTIKSRARPLYFASRRLDECFQCYLAERLAQGLGLGRDGAFRGLDPHSRLFLSTSGRGFEITPYGEGGRQRFRCRPILETYRRLFRYAGFKQMSAMAVRHTVAARLYARGADEGQVGLLLGIGERSAVREMFPRPQPGLDELVVDLI